MQVTIRMWSKNQNFLAPTLEEVAKFWIQTV